jgi:hypothetical protein
VSEPAESGDTNYILSQEEFRGGIEALAARQIRGEQVILGRIRLEADSLVSTAGWVMVSFAFWLLLVGFWAIRGELRGRP